MTWQNSQDTGTDVVSPIRRRFRNGYQVVRRADPGAGGHGQRHPVFIASSPYWRRASRKGTCPSSAMTLRAR